MSEAPVPAPGTPDRYRCPHCQSHNVRPSRRSVRFQWIHRLRGLEKYRCRDCRRSFFVALSRELKQAFQKEEAVRRKRRRGWRGFVQGSTERRTMEILLFLTMLILFYFILNAILKRDAG